MASTYYKIGSKGEDVKKIQQALVDAGYSVGKYGVDGVYGKDTEAAVRAYQKDKGLTVDGIVGQETLSSLFGSTKTQPAQSTQPTQTVQPATQPATQPTIQPTTQTTTQSVASSTAPNLSSLSSFNYAPKVEIPEYKSPYEEMINSLLEKYLNPEPFTYDYTKDPSYLAYASNYLRKGDEAFQDTIGELSSLTGGRLNTWATSAAAQAKNKYVQELNNIIPQLEQNAYNRYIQNYQNIANQLKMLQGLDADSYNKYRDTISDTRAEQDRAIQAYIDTIGQYYNDYQARIDEVLNDNDPSNDWEVPYLRAARQQKAQALEEQKRKDEQEAYEREMEQREWELKQRQFEHNKEMDQKKLDLDTRLTNAQIANYYADNARLAAQAAEKTASKAADVTKMGTPEQVNKYWQLRDIYFNDPKYAGKPFEAYQWLINNRQLNANLIGDKLYNYLLSELENAMKIQKTYSGESANTSAYNNILSKALSAKNKNPVTGELDAANIIVNSGLSEQEQLQLLDMLGIDLESLM